MHGTSRETGWIDMSGAIRLENGVRAINFDRLLAYNLDANHANCRMKLYAKTGNHQRHLTRPS